MSAWYAITTQPRKELQIWDLLTSDAPLREHLHVEDIYCPIETYHVRLRMQRQPVVRCRPLTPGYLFVRCYAPTLLKSELGWRGVTGVQRRAGSLEPARIADSALHTIKMVEQEIATGKRRRYDRSKRQIRNGSQIKIGDEIVIPHLKLNVKNPVVENIIGGKVQVTAGPLKIMVPIEDVEMA